MLKLFSTETSLHLEVLSTSLPDWIEQRQRLTTSIGKVLLILPGVATILLPDSLCQIDLISRYLQRQRIENVSVCRCDAEYIEVSLNGYWVYSDLDSTEADAIEGTFITEFTNRCEAYLLQLWQVAKTLLN
jgi:hypothetical protein